MKKAIGMIVMAVLLGGYGYAFANRACPPQVNDPTKAPQGLMAGTANF